MATATTATTSSAAPLALRDVSLVLGDGDLTVTALDHVDLALAAGELVAVVGPSGSGKSSLLAVAGTLLRPTTGSVEIAGVPVEGLDDRARTAVRRDRVGFVFQSGNLLPSLDATEQLLVAAHVAGTPRDAARRQAAELLASVGMAGRADRLPHQLSGGERQRVGIARALMGSPSVLLVDEPTSALDQQRSREIVSLLADQAHSRGAAALMVTHDVGLLDAVDRVLAMEDGRLTPAPPGVTSRP